MIKPPRMSLCCNTNIISWFKLSKKKKKKKKKKYMNSFFSEKYLNYLNIFNTEQNSIKIIFSSLVFYLHFESDDSNVFQGLWKRTNTFFTGLICNNLAKCSYIPLFS